MPLSATRVLIIDDNDAVRRIVRSVLEGLVDGIHEADGGLAGIRAWKALKPGLVILDFEMPQVNGVVVTRFIREQEAGSDRRTAILMMTGHGDEEHVSAARLAKVDGLIGKPLSVGAVLSKAEDALDRSERQFRSDQARAQPHGLPGE